MLESWQKSLSYLLFCMALSLASQLPQVLML